MDIRFLVGQKTGGRGFEGVDNGVGGCPSVPTEFKSEAAKFSASFTRKIPPRDASISALHTITNFRQNGVNC